MEDAGIPTVVVTTTAFLDLTNHVIDSFGLATARIACIPHPLGGISETEVDAKARALVEDLFRLFTTNPT